MSLNYGSVRWFQNGEPIDATVLNRPIEDLAKAVKDQHYDKDEIDNYSWSANSITRDLLHRDRIAALAGGEASMMDVLPVLTHGGNATASWISFQTLLTKYASQIGSSGYAWQGNVYTSPTTNDQGRRQGLQIVAATHVNAPVGMMVGYRTTYTSSWGTGNGSSSRQNTGTFLAFKVTSNQWYSIVLDAPRSSQTTDDRWD